jgi:hypothetical protein
LEALQCPNNWYGVCMFSSSSNPWKTYIYWRHKHTPQSIYTCFASFFSMHQQLPLWHFWWWLPFRCLWPSYHF